MILTIFFPALIKKYIVQSRPQNGAWQEVDSFRSQAQAEQAARAFRRQRPDREVRIINRMTGQVVRERR